MANTFNFAINFYPQLGASTIVCHSQDEIIVADAYVTAMEAMASATATRGTTPKAIIETVAKALRKELGCETVIVRADVTANVKGYHLPASMREEQEP